MFISHPDFFAAKPINVYHKEIYNSKETANMHPDTLRNKHILFRKKVNLPSFSKAVLKITADDYYKLYINGKFITEGPAPSYPNRYFYNEIDVTENLCEGECCFAVHTYYQGLINRTWVSGDLREMLACELYLDGVRVLETDESWLTKYHTGYTECGKFGYDTAYAECYDAASPDAKFYEPDFDDCNFIFAKKHLRSDWKLTKQPTKQLDI